jgi:hypothetical protein
MAAIAAGGTLPITVQQAFERKCRADSHDTAQIIGSRGTGRSKAKVKLGATAARGAIWNAIALHCTKRNSRACQFRLTLDRSGSSSMALVEQQPEVKP